MSKSVIYPKDYRLRDIDRVNYPVSKISDIDFDSEIEDRSPSTKRVNTAHYPISEIIGPSRKTKIDEVLPFRIRIASVNIPGYSASNVPGIGIQVIGFSNYIL